MRSSHYANIGDLLSRVIDIFPCLGAKFKNYFSASERETYVRRAITNRDDHKIRAELDDIDRLLDRVR